LELPAARAHERLRLRKPKRDEEETGLVDVVVVAVDDVDLQLVGAASAPELVRKQGSRRARSEDYELLGHESSIAERSRVRIRAGRRSSCGQLRAYVVARLRDRVAPRCRRSASGGRLSGTPKEERWNGKFSGRSS